MPYPNSLRECLKNGEEHGLKTSLFLKLSPSMLCLPVRKLQLPGRDVSRSRLDQNDVELIREVGISQIKEHARQVAEVKLREPRENDGMQTPIAGNPVYKAMHACHTASRDELMRAHGIPDDHELKDREIDAIVNLLIRWIAREYNFYRQEEEQQKSLGEF
jgi:hypothetical protein